MRKRKRKEKMRKKRGEVREREEKGEGGEEVAKLRAARSAHLTEGSEPLTPRRND